MFGGGFISASFASRIWHLYISQGPWSDWGWVLSIYPALQCFPNGSKGEGAWPTALVPLVRELVVWSFHSPRVP